MTATTDVLIPALREVREAEAAVADQLGAHAAVTPAGAYRETLEQRMGQARGHVHRIDGHMKTLQRRGRVQGALGDVLHATGKAARLPFKVAMAVPAAVLRGEATQRQLLKNAEEEYGVTAFAVARCRAGGHIARQADDTAGSALFDSIRRDDEDLLEALGLTLEQRAEEVVAAAGSSPAAGLTGAAHAVRSGASSVRQTAERWEHEAWDAARGAAERIAGAARTARTQALRAAVVAQDQALIPDYDELDAKQIIDRLPQLAQADLAIIDAYERSHAARSPILSEIGELLGPVPWPGYEDMSAAQIRTRLRDGEPDLARRTLAYERRHLARATVIAARAHLARSFIATQFSTRRSTARTASRPRRQGRSYAGRPSGRATGARR
jgi:hypothetical protein